MSGQAAIDELERKLEHKLDEDRRLKLETGSSGTRSRRRGGACRPGAPASSGPSC